MGAVRYDRRPLQAQTALLNAARMRAVSEAAAVEESVALVAGGSSETLADLRSEINELETRLDGLEEQP